MKIKEALGIGLLALVLASVGAPTRGVANDAANVDAASSVLREFMSLPAKQIPQSLLSDAKGIAIIPKVVKGGFVVGVHHGRGVLLTRDEAGRWVPPMVVSFTGGGVGWQAGLQSTDLILVFRTTESVNRVSEGKLTIGVDAAAAAGPVGRQANASTDATLSAEILSYSRSRGLFVGVSIDGSSLQVDGPATQMMYRSADGVPAYPVPAGQPLPKSVETLLGLLTKYSAGADRTAATTGSPVAPVYVSPIPPPPGGSPVEASRQKLARSSEQLNSLVDDNWKRFLALPREVYAAGNPPTPDAVATALKRYESLASNPTYATLNQRAEFSSTLQALREYYEALVARPNSLSLPPPPPTLPPPPNGR